MQYVGQARGNVILGQALIGIDFGSGLIGSTIDSRKN
jgi:hypothetical protein